MQFRTITARNKAGDIMEGANIQVYLVNTTTPVTVFNESGTAISAPKTDANGQIGFQAPNGAYDIVATTGETVASIQNVEFYSPTPQSLGDWEAGVSALESVVSPAKIKAAMNAQSFGSVSAFSTAVTAGFTAADGAVVSAGPVLFRASSSAATTGLPVGWEPFGAIMPDHWKDNLQPGVTDMTLAVQRAFEYLMAGTSDAMTADQVWDHGPSSADFGGNTYAIKDTIIIGRIDGVGNGWTAGLNIDNVKFSAISGGNFTPASTGGDVPTCMFAIADYRAWPDFDIRLANITFGENCVLDCNYLTGGRFWHNTKKCEGGGLITNIGFDAWGDRTSDGNASENVNGWNTRNEELLLTGRTDSGRHFDSENRPLLLDGISSAQTAVAAGPLIINGSQVTAGEFVSPIGVPVPVEVRTTFPMSNQGVVVTVNGFSDFAKTTAISDTITLDKHSTQWQHTVGTVRFAVVTDVSVDRAVSGSIAVGGSMINGGMYLRTPDIFITNRSDATMTYAADIDWNGHGQFVNWHPWSRVVKIGPNLSFPIMFSNCFFDSTDVRMQAFEVSLIGCNFFAGDTRIVVEPTAANEDLDGLVIRGPVVGPARTRQLVDIEPRGGALIGLESIKAKLDLAGADPLGIMPSFSAGPENELLVTPGGNHIIGATKGAGGGHLGSIHASPGYLRILGANAAEDDFDFTNGLSWDKTLGRFVRGAIGSVNRLLDLSDIIKGTDNVAVGEPALGNVTTGIDNTAVGNNALQSNVAGNDNTAVGFNALTSNTATGNTGVGKRALESNTTGANNAACGSQVLASNTTGTQNTGVGRNSLFSNTVGSDNTAAGQNSLVDLVSGNNNTAVGREAGRGITTGSNNTILGANVTGLAAALSNNIIIADGAGNQRINVDSAGDTALAGTVKTSVTTVAALPSAATVGVGARAFITDATTQAFGGTVTGGGSTPSPVYSDGTVWRIG